MTAAGECRLNLRIELSGIAPALTVLPDIDDYVVSLPLSQAAVSLTATVRIAGDTLRVDGTPVASGAPSPAIALALGDTEVDIVVENALGWQRTYRVVLRRAAPLAQFPYGKASNTGADDLFGHALALLGDTLAVGADTEDSAATGIDGDQDSQEAADSGAVYVFRRTDAEWAQEAYIKASNTDAGDAFGAGLALASDVLVVGAPGEDSAAAGVDGDQDDDTAVDSGAVYVFH
ncbi:cadherin-like beta sandwich domain-containing protein [Haliangium ochraceum]|uniref:Cadherin-like beta-sandwich-like domain-containing protein n=1 Tax=Haliangium ochraceum (strain DSM 14365 / JCM 11303 / SMP-2) TaxID=502025 RepID=D0LTJ5_HALO1|nr:cadherin-like beta sandwich domain-containing protein [Haliangium ochraceum]ACY13890.1 hypothetical protein Hoch_1333 [Haliangium ochraceum DSM 14365]